MCSRQIKQQNSLKANTEDRNVYCVRQKGNLYIVNDETVLCENCIIFYITRHVLNGGKVTALIHLKDLHVATRSFTNAPLDDYCDNCHKKLTVTVKAEECENCIFNEYDRVLTLLKRNYLILHGTLDFHKALREFGKFLEHLETTRLIFTGHLNEPSKK